MSENPKERLARVFNLALEDDQSHALVDALADFDRALTHARDMRDGREHISHYIRGKGNLQADGTAPGRQVRGGALAVTTWLVRRDQPIG